MHYAAMARRQLRLGQPSDHHALDPRGLRAGPGRGAAALGLRLVYDVAHNVAKFEDHRVEGATRRLCVHRKGATRAFGPGRAEVPAVYRDLGQPVIVPGDMGTASWLLLGTDGAMRATFGSTCHGAGRVLSRTAALKARAGHEVQARLRRAASRCARRA